MTGTPTDGTAAMRIDDLAHASGVSVDTIRYYRREGLLPPPTAAGRTKRYGPEHLERLTRIRELQERRFSLAAIRAFLDAERPGLVEGIFADDDQAPSYDLEELLRRSGVERELATLLRDAGVMRDPAEFGRDDYDGADLDLLRAVAELRELDMPDDIIVEVGRIYATGVEDMQRRILSVFRGRDVDWDPDELAAFQSRAAEQASELLPRVQRIVGYVHHRTLQRLTLSAIDEEAGES